MWPSWEQTLLVFAAAFLEGSVGFDFGLIAAPALGAILGLRDAVILLSLPNLALGILRVSGWKIPLDPLRRLMPFIGAGSIGAAVGVFTLLATPPIVLKWTVGILVLICAGYSFSKLRIQLDMRDEVFFAYLGGALSGWLSGFAYSGVPFIVIYLDSLEINSSRMTKMMRVSVLTFAAVQVAALTGTGHLPLPAAVRAAMSVLPALAGFVLGRRIRGLLSPALGYTVGLALLVAAAISLLVFGPGGWR